MYETLSCISTHACLACFKFIVPSPIGNMVGRTYGVGADAATTAKLVNTSRYANTLLRYCNVLQYPSKMSGKKSFPLIAFIQLIKRLFRSDTYLRCPTLLQQCLSDDFCIDRIYPCSRRSNRLNFYFGNVYPPYACLANRTIYLR